MTLDTVTPAAEPEEFHFLRWGFDITALRHTLKNSRTKPQHTRVHISNVAGFLESDPLNTTDGRRVIPLIGIEVIWSHVDELHEKHLRGEPLLDSPVFVAPMGELGSFVIDGWHRIALARRLELETLPAVVFSRRQIQRALLRGSAPLPKEAKTSSD